MDCCTYRQCSSVICCTVDGMLHIQAMLVCFMLHSWWNVALTAIFFCYMIHSWWNVAHTGNVRLFDATQLMECCLQAIFVCYMAQLMECCTYRQCSSVICYTVDGMLHTQAMFVCYMLHSWWNVAHAGNVRLLYATQLMECCTYRQCSSVICYTVDGMLHIQAMFVCYMLHSWWNVAHTGNVRLLYATQLMECCTYRECTFVCYMLHSWWNVAHAGNVRLLYATQLMECCT